MPKSDSGRLAVLIRGLLGQLKNLTFAFLIIASNYITHPAIVLYEYVKRDLVN